MDVKLKICGMKFPNNILEICTLNPDYIGFIFWDKSLRRFEDNEIIKIPENIKKVGVFVNETIEEILRKVMLFELDAVQLHGQEKPIFCNELKKHNIEVIKAFSVGEGFEFKVLNEYEDNVDYFLFDTKGRLPGGNGITFDWKLLESYKLETPFFLSGGIGLTGLDSVKEFLKSKAAKNCYGIDVNSRFEKKPGLKNLSKLKRLKKNLYATEI